MIFLNLQSKVFTKMTLSRSQFLFLSIVGLLLATTLSFSLAHVNAAEGFKKEKLESCPAPNLNSEQHNPNAYPSVQMGRYQFIRAHYRILRFLADCYFMVVNAVFDLWNAFQPANHVLWHSQESHLLFIPAFKAAEMIRQGKLKSRDLVQAYVNRMRDVNGTINALHKDNGEAALELAEEYDKVLAARTPNERERFGMYLPLYGVPISIKANLWVKGFATSACNIYLMNGTASDKNAPIVQRAFDAGAIMLGITTMPNGGLSWFGDDSGCGQVKNPHDTRRTSGGSSSGEGTLIAAGGSPFGYGNDIGGSVRNPAHMSGIFGLKPTNYPDHTVPVEGIEPNYIAYEPAKQQLTNGPLVRYAEDLPLILSIMAGKNQSEYVREVDFANDFKLYYLEDIEILVGESLHEEQRNSVRRVKNYFEQKYGLNVLKLELPLMNRLNEFWGLTGWSKGKMSIPEAISHIPEVYSGTSNHTFLDLEFYVMKQFTTPKDQNERAFVRSKLEKLRKQLNDTLGPNGVLLLPVLPTSQPFHHMEPFVNFNLYFLQIFNMLGHPAITVPTGKSAITNMPLGVQFAAGPYNEALLIAVAREMEKAFGGWVMPGEVPQGVLDRAKKFMEH